MPFSADPQIRETSTGLVSTLRAAAAQPTQEFRPAHAKGHLLTGTFTPTPAASSLTTAPHFNLPSVPTTIRFSSSTGLPQLPDTDPAGNPHGIAIRFHLPEAGGRRRHTDMIAHSTPLFPVRTGGEFLEFLRAAGGADASTAVPEFLGRHPETRRFLEAGKPSPVSFATERFFGVNAFRFLRDGTTTTLRYRIEPVAGAAHLDASALAGRAPDWLFDELNARVAAGPVEFRLLAQIAADGDTTDDATVLWPEDRAVVQLGTLRVEGVLGDAESRAAQKQVIFDPIPRVEGVEVSDDPLLEVRANVYLASGQQRRAA
ncbi:catalase-like domain-containing protein [Boeremia exigua]|uniref:catalase-like domain-containing protein n=1 Tax=Boeremia exigua TaxID=749465 RepID=UPI001E8D0C68|nr:catalase-like domain-containing protein [Boeremia exigua]KAH6620276.1 catalase-like domain-containing protein [Boeremia exigua]